MISGFDSSRCLHELRELDRLIDENSVQVLEQRNILAHLHNGKEAEAVLKFLNDLLSTRQFYIADRERLLMNARG